MPQTSFSPWNIKKLYNFRTTWYNWHVKYERCSASFVLYETLDKQIHGSLTRISNSHATNCILCFAYFPRRIKLILRLECLTILFEEFCECKHMRSINLRVFSHVCMQQLLILWLYNSPMHVLYILSVFLSPTCTSALYVCLIVSLFPFLAGNRSLR